MDSGRYSHGKCNGERDFMRICSKTRNNSEVLCVNLNEYIANNRELCIGDIVTMATTARDV